MKTLFRPLLAVLIFAAAHLTLIAQQRLETGGKKMPDEWIDKDTGHKIIRLVKLEGKNTGFYFTNNPYFHNKMVFYNVGSYGKQIYSVDMKTHHVEQVTHQASPMSGELVGQKTGNVYYQISDSIFSTNIKTKATKLLFVFPANYKGSISTINADETVMAGAKASDEQKEILRKYPAKSDFFNRVFDARLPNDLWKVDLRTGKLSMIHTENTWLGHVQFSPTNSKLLMFCHEGPWDKVDRIWTINIDTKEVKLMHKRTMNMEIAGHEWWAPDGQTIWFDLQQPRSVKFFVAGTNVVTLQQKKYEMQRDEWSIHFNISPNQKMFCGDGGDPGQVAKAKDGMWINLFTPEGDRFVREKLVNMSHHGYKSEPNVHFSPDGQWVVFHANFEGGDEQVYAVEIKKKLAQIMSYKGISQPDDKSSLIFLIDISFL